MTATMTATDTDIDTDTSTRQEIVIHRSGPAASLSVSEAPFDETLADDEVAIAVRYSGINFADIMMRLGLYPDAPKRPYVPGYEVSGHVEAVGDGVTDLQVGDPVIAGSLFGGYASRIKVPAHQVFPLAEGLTLESGAALPVAFFTAHLALFEMGRVRAGDRVLIECATGGVGTLAVQMARHVGAEVVGLTTSPGKKPFIEGLGARALTREEFHASDERDFDFILNASGGGEVRRQMKRLGLTGRIVCMGMSSGLKDGRRSFLRLARTVVQMPLISVFQLFNPNIGIFGLNALTVLQDEAWVRRLTEALATVSDMDLEPHVGRVFPAAEVADAHRYLETKQAKGKVLLAW